LKGHYYPTDFRGLSLPVTQGKFHKVFQVFQNPLEKLICLHHINHVYARAVSAPDQWQFLTALLQALDVHYNLAEEDLARIPAQGPVVVVSNHPFGGVEGIILPALLGRVRRDVKILANYLLRPVIELQDLFIYVDPFSGKGAARANLAGLRKALLWLQQGGLLAVFPAGEVSHLTWPHLKITDPVWSTTVAGLIRKSRAQVVPLFFAGHNGALFQCLGLIHPLLRTALLPREAVNKSGKTIQIKIGRVIGQEKIRYLGSDDQVTEYLRLRTYMLQENFSPVSTKNPLIPRSPVKKKNLLEKIIPALDQKLLIQEVNNLPTSQILVHSGNLAVCYAEASQIPHLLREIGRLREVTFRIVHEGTGKAVDLDRFDAHYLHLFLWNHDKQELVGAYRLGRTDQILASLGPRGLYTTTLFDFEGFFLKEIHPAVELGRSFIREEYQKNYSALLLLWKGIGRFVVRNPHYQILFGPVSISNAYNEFSQGLLATWLRMNSFLPELAQFIRPKNPFQVKKCRSRDLRLALTGTRKVEELSALIADLDPKQKGVPILLKQYLKLGGKLLGFNRDPHFNNALDGLILVDLLQTPHQVLQRYMGKEGLADFLQYHSRPYYSYHANQPAEKRLQWVRASFTG